MEKIQTNILFSFLLKLSKLFYTCNYQYSTVQYISFLWLASAIGKIYWAPTNPLSASGVMQFNQW